ncbi:hypothetical protein BJX64DRAFT_247757 [Aspergillus heterothallicus]
MVHRLSGVLRSNRPRSRKARLPQINRFGELCTEQNKSHPGSFQFCPIVLAFNLAVSEKKWD